MFCKRTKLVTERLILQLLSCDVYKTSFFRCLNFEILNYSRVDIFYTCKYNIETRCIVEAQKQGFDEINRELSFTGLRCEVSPD